MNWFILIGTAIINLGFSPAGYHGGPTVAALSTALV